MSTAVSFFDTRHTVMQQTIQTDGCWSLCYQQQVSLVESLIRPGSIVLDVGCGPALPYRAPSAYVIGLDPSAESLAQNTDVDERIVGTAERIPLPDASVDMVVAFYAVHHMTGQSTYESDERRIRALGEMTRVLRPGGSLLIFEMVPTGMADLLQDMFWNMTKETLGDRLDAYFWASERFAWTGIPFETTTFGAPWYALIPPVCSLPWLRMPRFLYPFAARLFRWEKPCPPQRVPDQT